MYPYLLALALGAPPPPPAPTPAPASETVAELVPQLEACEDMQCPPLKALVAKGDKVWPELELGVDHANELVRFWSLGVLSEVPVAAARPKLVLLLSDPLVRIRAAAAFALGAQRSPEVVPALIGALGDPDVNVRFEAASALVRVPDPRALEPLLAVLSDDDVDVRRTACEALAAFKDERAEKALLERLQKDKKAVVRGHAAIALGNQKNAAAVDALVARSERERDEEALAAMAWALGEIGDAKARAALDKLAGHASELVKREASTALGKLAPAPIKK
jgi:HEAT repeat protein